MTGVNRSVVIHGHFYQPPREDPWTDQVPVEENAAPFHDWNERIEQECYRPITRVRVLDQAGRTVRRVNALEHMSFNFGPTLLRWMERHAPDTYDAVLAADRRSRTRLDGCGNALAMPYHHLILPLASRRDKQTEVRWGIADFRRRFGRDPLGMWLPETAVDRETLDVLGAEGIVFTVLAPVQVETPPAGGRPGIHRTESGRQIAVYVYDGELSHGVAFGALLKDTAAWETAVVEALGAPAADSPALVSLAADGETFGHHHKFAEMALAAVLERLHERPDVQLDNFESFLSRHPPVEEIRLIEPSSWSCSHGVERWRSDCGCKMAPERESQQEWRAPLRDSLEWLASELHTIFETEGSGLFQDPWSVRDELGAIGRSDEEMEAFLQRHLGAPGDGNKMRQARRLLEMEWDALRMFTSCGWFFDDLSGLEPIQVLRYAAHAIDLAGPAGPRLTEGLLERLALAPANDPEVGDAARLYRERIAS
jgi:alpha-amylase/alpha-mannosidase (GH57 family)